MDREAVRLLLVRHGRQEREGQDGLLTALGADVSVPHASVTELEHWPQGRHRSGAPRHTVLHRLGDVAHLAPESVSGR